MKTLRHDGHLYTLINSILASPLKNTKALKGRAVEANMIKVSLLQAAEYFCIRSDTLKEWASKANKKHERMNKVSR